MSGSLLTTRLFFPATCRSCVPRPRLTERLSAGLRGPLTLLSAPAGYGKTILLSEWRAGQGARFPAAWLSLDASDCDLILFLTYLAGALETLRADLVEKTKRLLEPPQPPPMSGL